MSAEAFAVTDRLREDGEAMHRLAAGLFPICRSITGAGLRHTLDVIGRLIPLERFEVPTGEQVFDWTVPKEWNLRNAYIKDLRGNTVVSLANSSLHVLNYSAPVRGIMPAAELRQHIHTIPGQPGWIPYRTSYFKETWGFCLTHEQFLALTEPEYEVLIDASLEPGHLSYGECRLAGATDDEVLFSCHVCHPSLANDNLSGIVVAVFLARHLSRMPRKYSYRFLFIPGTIGAITWLARNRQCASRIRHGLVLTCLGDAGGLTYKRSRRGDAGIDRAAACVLAATGQPYQIRDFWPYGYDERQYCSPGFNLPVGCLMRSVYGEFPEYHTSADNLDFIRPAQLAASLGACEQIVEVLEHDARYRNRQPYCEPQLGKRNLYRSTGGTDIGVENMAKLWVLNLSDGDHSLLDIAERARLPFAAVRKAAAELAAHELLEKIEEPGEGPCPASPGS